MRCFKSHKPVSGAIKTKIPATRIKIMVLWVNVAPTNTRTLTRRPNILS